MKATLENTGTFNTLHGHGSMLAIGGNGQMPWFVEKQGDKWCVVKGTREDPIETEACHATEELAQAQMRALYASESKGIDEASHVAVYKSADGKRRWASISSVAVKDKEFQIVTEKAQDDAIQHAIDTGEFGELDLVHVDGTDVGDCDLMMRAGKQLIEGGSFYDTELANGVIKALEEEPDYWGTSIKFVYDPSKFDGEKYNGNIRIKKRTILPQEMAASYGTRLVAIGGEYSMEQKELSPQAREALAKLNVPEEDIEKLAEKQVEPEPNTVEKEAEVEKAGTVETPEPEVEKAPNLWERIKAALSKPEAEKADEPDAETGGEETEEVVPVEAQEKVEEVDVQEMVKGMFDAYTGATVEAVQKALAVRDGQIVTLGEAILSLTEQIKELKRPLEERVEKRLAELPRVVKAAPSQVAVMDQPAGRVLPGSSPSGDQAGEFVKSVQSAVERVTARFEKVQT